MEATPVGYRSVPLVLVDLLSYTGSKGGMETYTRELYSALGQSPEEFTFTGFASTEAYHSDTSWFPGDIVDSRISGENRLTWAWGELFSVSRYASRVGADLIHSPATLGPISSRIPTVITMHDMLYFSHPEYMSTPVYTEPVKWMEKMAARNATRILTDSETSAAEIVKYLGYPRDRLQVIHLAGPNDAKQSSRSRKSDLLIAVGNRRPHKNFEGLVRAMALVHEDIRPTLVITGSRGDDPLRPLVDGLGLEPWIELRQWISDDELLELYETATALLVPAFAEGFGLPILEAMGVGLPTIVSNLPVFREVAGDATIFFDPASDRSIADAISQVATDASLRKRLSHDGLKQASRFSWHKVAFETISGFRTALVDSSAEPRSRPSGAQSS